MRGRIQDALAKLPEEALSPGGKTAIAAFQAMQNEIADIKKR